MVEPDKNSYLVRSGGWITIIPIRMENGVLKDKKHKLYMNFDAFV